MTGQFQKTTKPKIKHILCSWKHTKCVLLYISAACRFPITRFKAKYQMEWCKPHYQWAVIETFSEDWRVMFLWASQDFSTCYLLDCSVSSGIIGGDEATPKVWVKLLTTRINWLFIIWPLYKGTSVDTLLPKIKMITMWSKHLPSLLALLRHRSSLWHQTHECREIWLKFRR